MYNMQNKNNAGLRFSTKSSLALYLRDCSCLFGILFIISTRWKNRIGCSYRDKLLRRPELTEILQDNLEDNGTRVGEQKVRCVCWPVSEREKSWMLQSSAGYLFGAGCEVGMKVIVMQSVAGDTTIASVYTQDREWVIYIFAALYLLALCVIGGRQGIKGCIGLVFTFSAWFLFICRWSTGMFLLLVLLCSYVLLQLW